MRHFTILIAITFLLISLENKAQIVNESQPTSITFKTSYKFNAAIEKELESENPMGKFQAFLDYSNKGEFRKAQELDDIERDTKTTTPLSTKQIDSINSQYSAVEAVDFIVTEAKKHKITIINEAHHNPRHRVFTMSLLKELFNSGYTHLGLEALYNGPKGGTFLGNGGRIRDERDSLLNERKYPIPESGTYTQEPQFGNLIRYALELGFTIFPYEKTGVGSGYPREIGQAKNIETVIRKNPNAKILIHCGFAHAYEGHYEAWGKTMAGHLKELTGINPLSINQVKYSEHSKAEYNTPLYNAIDLKNSSVLVDNSGKAMGFVEGEAFTDIAIIHPPTVFVNSRPSWLYQNEVENVEMDLTIFNFDTTTMIMAFKKSENIESVIPVDIIEVDAKETKANLALKPGEYTLIASSIEGEAKKVEITVN